MGLKADIFKALRVSLDKEDSEHLAKEIMDRLPPVYAAAPRLLAHLVQIEAVCAEGAVMVHETGKPQWSALDCIGGNARKAIAQVRGDTP